MTIYEETGDDVVCLICGSDEYFECGHLVAEIDRTFLDCYGGALYDRDYDFRSVLDEKLLRALKDEFQPNSQTPEVKELWQWAKKEFHPGDDEVDIDGDVFWQLLVDTLEGCGAINPSGSLIVPGGPGMTSFMSVMFSEKPSKVVDQALSRWVKILDRAFQR